MKVVLALDSFKGNLTALEACESVQKGILAVFPECDVVICPMADGGEGTVEALRAARGGQWITCTVTGPLPDRSVEAGFGWCPDDGTALVEMAHASGITLLQAAELNPLHTTTYGTGELMRAALEKGARRIILAIGGSATVDGGIGAAMALGWEFLNQNGEPVGLGGKALRSIHSIKRGPKLGIPVDVLCDVSNPLTGPQGAATVFGPQKGATPQMVEQLEAGLSHWARVARAQLGIEIEFLPGAGAAGGLGAGMIACAGAKLVPGIETVMSASQLEEKLAGADWVISGEGKFDEPSLGGKVVSGILSIARTLDVRMGVIAGQVDIDESLYRKAGLEFAWGTAPEGMPLEEVLRQSKENLAMAATRFAETYLKE